MPGWNLKQEGENIKTLNEIKNIVEKTQAVKNTLKYQLELGQALENLRARHYHILGTDEMWMNEIVGLSKYIVQLLKTDIGKRGIKEFSIDEHIIKSIKDEISKFKNSGDFATK